MIFEEKHFSRSFNWTNFVAWFWKIYRKIPVKVLRTPILYNICWWLLLNQLDIRYIHSFQKSVYRRRKSMKIISGWPLNVSTSYSFFSTNDIITQKITNMRDASTSKRKLPAKIFYVYFISFICSFIFLCFSSDVAI